MNDIHFTHGGNIDLAGYDLVEGVTVNLRPGEMPRWCFVPRWLSTRVRWLRKSGWVRVPDDEWQVGDIAVGQIQNTSEKPISAGDIFTFYIGSSDE